jgi:hypothetical protein
MNIAKNGLCKGIRFNDNVPDICISCIKGKFAKRLWEPPMATSHRLPKAVSKQQLDKQD